MQISRGLEANGRKDEGPIPASWFSELAWNGCLFSVRDPRFPKTPDAGRHSPIRVNRLNLLCPVPA